METRHVFHYVRTESPHTMQFNVILRWPVHDELLGARLSSQRSVFEPRPGHVIFMVIKLALEEVFSSSNSIFPIRLIPSLFPTLLRLQSYSSETGKRAKPGDLPTKSGAFGEIWEYKATEVPLL